MNLIPAVSAKWSAFLAFIYNVAAHTKRHLITALYLLALAMIIIPVGDVVVSYWKPTVMTYHKRFAAPAIEPAPAKKVIVR